MPDDLFFDPALFGLEEDNISQKRRHQLREGELREVTVLFADIKGFTNLSTHLEPEVIHARMDELFKIFSRCVTFYGGFVDKYIGDAIMALFGAKHATEQDTERAIRAGFKMLEQLNLYNHKLGQQPGYENVELSVRIGINTGIVSVGKVGQSREGDFTVYGPQVNLASRMESNAPVGRIMLPFATKKLVEQIFEFEHLGLKEVKGVDEPVDCWSPLGLKLFDLDFSRSFTSGFIGRENELAALGLALNQIQTQTAKKDSELHYSSPRPFIYGISAEAGIGKSRLVYEFRKSHTQDALFIQAACDGVSPTPLHLFARLFAGYFKLSFSQANAEKLSLMQDGFDKLCLIGDAGLKEALQDAFPLIAWLLEIPTSDARLAQGGKDLLQHLQLSVNTLLEAIKLQCAQAGKPLVLILDDLHWMDDSSALALEHLINSFSQSQFPSLVLLLYRPQYKPPNYLIRMHGWKSMELDALDEKSITELLLKSTRHLDLSEHSIQQVVARSSGNPFYLEEWCNYISSIPEKAWQDMPVPATLNALILSRLDSLPQALKALLQKAAVIGQEFFVDVLKEVEQNLEDPMDIESSLADLEQHSLILKHSGLELSSYFFKHINTREVAYQTLLIANRKLLHQLTAEAIQSLFADRLDEFSFALGTHFLKADMPEQAKPWLKKAADSAARVYDNSQALGLYSQLIEITDPGDYGSQGELLLACMEIKWLTGLWKDLETDIDTLLELGAKANSPILGFHAHRLAGMLAFQTAQHEIAKEHWDQAAALASQNQDKMPKCIIENLLGIWYQHHDKWDQALQHHQASLELAHELEDPQREAKTLNNMGLLYLSQKHYDKALESFNQSLTIARSHRLLKDEALAAGNLGHANIVMEKYADAMPYLQIKLELTRMMNDKYETIMALGNMARAYRNMKLYPDAIACLEHIIKIKQYLGDEDGIKDTQGTIEKIIQASKQK